MSNRKKPTSPWLRVRPRRIRVKWEPRRMNRRRTQMMRRQDNVIRYVDRLNAPLWTKELDQDLALRDMDEHHISSF